VNLWIKRALGAAALGGGLLAFTAGAAGAQEVSADVSARLGRPTSADVRVCADGRLLSRLVGSCNSSGTTGNVQADRGVRVRARVPRLASADVSIGARRSRPRATVSADASVAPRSSAATAGADAGADTSPRADADAAASLSRPRAGRLLDLDATASLAGVGLLGSSPFTLAGDPAGGPLLAIGDLTLADVADEAPAGIGVLDAGPIASGNQAAVDVGDVSPSVPVMVCGNGVGVLGDASASCGTSQPAAGASGPGSGSSGTDGTSDGSSVSATTGSLLDGTASGNQVDAGIGSISPSVPVTVCGNGVGALGDASAACGTAQPSGSGGSTSTGGPPAGGSDDDTATVSSGGISPSVPVTVCGNGVGLLGDASVACAADTSTGGTTAPPPGTTTPGGSTDTDGISGTPGSTDTSGIPGTTGLTPGTDGGPGDPVTTFSPLRPSVADSSSLPFTGAASDLLALVAAGLLAAGVLIVRAARPAAATEGGEDR
jgi:hypothetical protein